MVGRAERKRWGNQHVETALGARRVRRRAKASSARTVRSGSGPVLAELRYVVPSASSHGNSRARSAATS